MYNNNSSFCSNASLWSPDLSLTYYALGCSYLFIWLSGVLGNIMNISIFSLEGTMIRPGNTIPWWLSVNDLLHLIVLASYQSLCKGCLMIGIFCHYTLYSIDFFAWLQLGNVFLLEVFHTVGIGLNIMLALGRYWAAVNRSQNLFRDDRFVKRTVTALYVLSLIVYLPIPGLLTVDPQGPPADMTYHVVEVRESAKIFINVCIIIYGLFLRFAPFIGLAVISGMFIWVLMKTRQVLRLTSRDVSLISTQQRRIDRLYIGTTVVIAVMFLMTEIPIGVANVLWLKPGFSAYPEWLLLNQIQLPIFLLNSSYTILCYAIAGPQYRKTLKSMLMSVRSSLGFSPENQIDNEPADVNIPLQTLSR